MKGMTLWLVSLVLVSSAQAGWFDNPEQEAEARFKQGDYAGAAEGFADPYRQGVALYRAGRHAEAADAFAHTQRPNVADDAAYNRGTARFQVGAFAGPAEACEQVLVRT